MPAVAAPSHLAANLAALGERHADLIERLERIEKRGDVEFLQTPEGVPAATAGGRLLCSRHRPLEEAERLADSIDLIENAVVVVLGFGLGWHVERLARRMGRTGVIVVFEPDLALLRAVFERIDHSPWLADALIVWVSDAEDRAALARKLEGAEAVVAQGVKFLEHPGSRARLHESVAAFTGTVRDFVKAAKVSLMTTLIRSVETVRNLLLNLDHYAGGAGITDLKNIARGRPAIVVSAGPSLARNMHRLADPGVRARCVIIAAQTTLQPLLRAGVKPHFVTALDYHEISQRFYESLGGHDLSDVTLVAEPKAHPVILDAFPGPVRCCRSAFCDQLLGPLAADHGEVPAGATVAHLAVYLARYLGCDPIALIGQDLGFSDGLYYAPGTAIDEVWAPELNPFNTIEMMQWQRIARHRLHLQKTTDVHGRPIYTDAQMETYRQQFERDFAAYAREGLTIIDATEGGVEKRHARRMPLQAVLARYAKEALPPLPLPPRRLDEARLRAAAARVAQVQEDVMTLRAISRRTITLIESMLADQGDAARMEAHFKRLDEERAQVQTRLQTLELLNHLNQMGVYRRFKADRRLELRRRQKEDPLSLQRAQLERDLANVTWIADAAGEFTEQLAASARLLRGQRVSHRPGPVRDDAVDGCTAAASAPSRVAALVPVDPQRSGAGTPRSLAEPFAGRPVIQATLERLGQCASLEAIVLIVPRSFDVEALIDRDRIGRPLEIERVEGSPFPPEQAAIAAARAWCESSWRGGIGGMSVYDEVLCPQVMHEIMARRGFSAALLAGPDWPLIDVAPESGCEAVVRRHLEHRDRHGLVFTQAPPGLCGCLVTAGLMAEMAQRSRLATVGSLLVYQPHAPQGDPIARDANVQIVPDVRRSLRRFTFDGPRHRRLLLEALALAPDLPQRGAPAVVATVEEAWCRTSAPMREHVIIELTTRRTSSGLFAAERKQGAGQRGDMPLDVAEARFAELARTPDVAVTFDGAGDPLLHPHFDRMLALARRAGLRHLHVRTELLAGRDVINRLLDGGVEVVSVDLHAACAATYVRMMGEPRFLEVLENIEHLVMARTVLAGPAGPAGLALPWVVPRIQRRRETCEDLNGFFEHWQHRLGTCIIEGAPGEGDLAPAVTPAHVVRDRGRREETILSGACPP